MKKYLCPGCGYIYDPVLGDPEGGIAPGTAFEDIPDSWVCPLCGITKAEFEVVEEKKEATVKTQQYICTGCGYVYDPALGDPEGGIAPGTAFEDIPDDWVCPLCGVAKAEFEVVK